LHSHHLRDPGPDLIADLRTAAHPNTPGSGFCIALTEDFQISMGLRVPVLIFPKQNWQLTNPCNGRGWFRLRA
jgi:hypothetical protein